MMELEAIGEHRLFVPTPGDTLVYCSQCATRVSHFGGDVPEDDLTMLIGLQAPTECCNAELATRIVP
jgi:hypothetical protein